MDANKPSPLYVALAAFLLAAASPAMGGVTTVYKCFDRELGVLYTDQPCRGEQLDIEAGRADPAALAELQREREALSRAMAQRIADNRRAPVDAPAYVVGPPPMGPDVYYPAGFGYGYAPYAEDRVRNRGGDNARARPTRAIPAVPPNGITNRAFR